MTKRTTFAEGIGAARSWMSAIRAVLFLLMLGGGLPALPTQSARAAVVFSNYTGTSIGEGNAGAHYFASGFAPDDSYDFTGAAAYVRNNDPAGAAQPFSMALYAATDAGGPASPPLWTSAALTVPAPNNSRTLVSTSYSGPPILLQEGMEYFLALVVPEDPLSVIWLGNGSSETPLYYSDDGTGWTPGGSSDSQFEVFGNAVPEPSTWAMMLIGLAVLSHAAFRRKRSSAREECPRCVATNPKGI